MLKFDVGQSIQERCTSCYHNVLKVIKVVPKEFEDKTAYVVWTQCPECGNNDHQLTQQDA
ncbi:hypothetical protein GLW00_06815 [Halobacillus litoralis]|uniref:Uncharacterized protein n=1 Tax=Halobacillus litoralis TaxID=45668 RepID=A0A845F8A7_9BACI|nr:MULTISPECIES: hypothetical protein [Halobacillus]MBN9654159.1 hypothetical protein [Halobacillus sp. GSS1]MEC3885811.1 hypothetical protein [Halobacillus sp. HZG1]MYL70552.1 hypothetical protein [Halobacillus litoralis]